MICIISLDDFIIETLRILVKFYANKIANISKAQNEYIKASTPRLYAKACSDDQISILDLSLNTLDTVSSKFIKQYFRIIKPQTQAMTIEIIDQTTIPVVIDE